MASYASKTNQPEELNQNQGATHPMYQSEGPRVDVSNGTIELRGTIVLYGPNNNTEIAKNHFEKGIKAWNKPSFAPGTAKENQIGKVRLNGQMVTCHLDINVVVKTQAQVQRELAPPAQIDPSTVYILVSNDTVQDYNENRPQVLARTLNATPADLNYAQQTVTNNGGVYNPGMVNQNNMLPTSFIIGNLGYYDLPTSQINSNTSAAHEIGHWLSHHFPMAGMTPSINGNPAPNNFDPHYPIALNAPNNPSPDFWQHLNPLPRRGSRKIMSFSQNHANRKPFVDEVARLGYGQDFNVYARNAARPTAHYLGDRDSTGNLLQYTAADVFSNPAQANIFQQLNGGPQGWAANPNWNPLPFWNPLTDPVPQ